MKGSWTRLSSGFFVLSTAALLFSGCSPASVDDSSPEGSPSPASGAEATWASIVTFNEALAAQDWTTAAGLASPGTAASEYVDYRAQVDRAQQAVGIDTVADEQLVTDESTGSVTITVRTEDEPVSITWTGFETDEADRVVGWANEQGPLADQVRGQGPQEEAMGASVVRSSAYLTASDGLYVVLEVSAADDALITDPEAILQLADGRTQPSSTMVGPSDIPPGTSASVVYTFPDAPLDGTIVYEVQNTYDAPVAVRLPVS
jgi:hypothetical protein